MGVFTIFVIGYFKIQPSQGPMPICRDRMKLAKLAELSGTRNGIQQT